MPLNSAIRAFRRQHAIYEKRAARAFYLAIRAQIRSFVLKGEGADPDTISPDPIIKAFSRVWRTIGVEYAGKAHRAMLREEGGKSAKDADPYAAEYTSLIDEYLKVYGAKKIARITETTRKWVRDQLSSGHAQGLLYDQIAAAMVNDDINISRAMLIARTESTGAMNFARFMAAAKSEFLKEKNWFDSGDARVRPDGDPNSQFDHHHQDIGIVPLGNPFFVSGEELMFPGDTSHGASAGNICNCRCSFGLKTLRDANGRMMRKPVGDKPAMIAQLELHGNVGGSSLTDIVYGLLGMVAAGDLGNTLGDFISNLFANLNP